MKPVAVERMRGVVVSRMRSGSDCALAIFVKSSTGGACEVIAAYIDDLLIASKA